MPQESPRPIVGTYNVDDPSTYGHHTSAPPVLGFSVLGILVLTAWALFARETAAIVFVLFVAIGKTGSIRLGPDHSRPQFWGFSWSAMLFATGIGVDLMFSPSLSL